MLRIKEKLKAIWHIITDDEYAIYTVTVKNGVRVKGRSACLISDNASGLFLETIVEFTGKCLDRQKRAKEYISRISSEDDYLQWFTNGQEFILCDRDDWMDMLSVLCAGGKYNYDRNGELSKDFHKASAKEIIDYFMNNI